ncbi:unnamed protein product [Echinostoma caproni]|uniref:Ubiquitin carboxyl-terminal hydrolase n=1 Tax=Echinostoma caproni TaxID=27848 RepID=A0A183A7R4_9TREM|nr:unnamed protein product [Echinostoma caproni]
MDVLMKDLSLSASHLSMYTGTMTTSSESEDETHDNHSVAVTSRTLDRRSVVTPNAPKTILVSPASSPNSLSAFRSSQSRGYTSTKGRMHYDKVYHTYSSTRSATPLVGQSYNAASSKSSRLRGKIPSFSSLTGGQTLSTPHVITITGTSSGRNSIGSRRTASNVDSVEDFLHDTQLNKSEYDPCGETQRHSSDAFKVACRRAFTPSLGDRTSESRTSSGRFSPDSAQSLPPAFAAPPRTSDRRRRRQSRMQTRF